MRRLLRTLPPAAALAALSLGATTAAAQPAVAPARGFAPHQLLVRFEGQRVGGVVTLPPAAGVLRAAAALRLNPRVIYAEPNYVATASTASPPDAPLDPNDPGTLGGASESSSLPDGWASKQWNFLAPEGTATARLPTSPGGIDAVHAWRHLIEAGRPGADGVIVAVLDTGIAYRDYGGAFRGSPDFSPDQFLRGYDFVSRDRLPLDTNGHGTHVAGTIAERTENGIGLTGLAYRAKLMPLRVLNREGVGYTNQIARGIRYAVAHRAAVINLSFNFDCGQRVPMVDEALRLAYRRGVVTVASGGNLAPPSAGKTRRTCVPEPATGPRVIGVGGTTEGACMGTYSLAGAAIDLVAPGGGEPRKGCPSILDRPIYQVTFRPKTTTEFAIPDGYDGTSMAAAHVSGVAAMILASGVVGPQPTPRARVDAVFRQLRITARDIGYPESLQGAGLIDAARATEPLP